MAHVRYLHTPSDTTHSGIVLQASPTKLGVEKRTNVRQVKEGWKSLAKREGRAHDGWRLPQKGDGPNRKHSSLDPLELPALRE